GGNYFQGLWPCPAHGYCNGSSLPRYHSIHQRIVVEQSSNFASIMNTIAIVDYGMGNLRSVSKALEYVAPSAIVMVTSDPAIIRQASRVVVPGQGAMPHCMQALADHGLRQAVLEA